MRVHDLIASERAFYGASTGIEQGFYRLAIAIKKRGGTTAPADIPLCTVSGFVDYNLNGTTQNATYEGFIVRATGVACGVMTGTFAGEQRRIQIGPDNCPPPDPSNCVQP